MELSINKLPECQVELKIGLSAEEFGGFFEKAVLKLGENLEVKGFRKGKAPKNIIEERIGSEKILAEAAEMAIEDSYKKAVLENNIGTISRPEIKIQKLAKGNPFIFLAKVSVLPEIELPDYKDIAAGVSRKKVLVEEKEINDALKWLQRSRAKLTLKNKPAQKGDFVEIEYQSPQIKMVSGEDKIKDAFILGEGRFLPDFEENLIGMEAVDGKEEKEFSLAVPEKHQLRKYGKEIALKVKIKSVQNVEFPEINDQFAKSLGKFEGLKGLKESVRQGLVSEKEQAESRRIREEILEKISQETKCRLPEILVRREQNQMLENLKKNVSEKFKVSWEEYLKKLPSRAGAGNAAGEKTLPEKQDSEWVKEKEKEILDSFLPGAEKNIKKLLVLREIGKKEKIEVSEEEVSKKIEEILSQYSSPEEARKNIGVDPQELREYTKETIKNEKIFALLEKLAKN